MVYNRVKDDNTDVPRIILIDFNKSNCRYSFPSTGCWQYRERKLAELSFCSTSIEALTSCICNSFFNAV